MKHTFILAIAALISFATHSAVAQSSYNYSSGYNRGSTFDFGTIGGFAPQNQNETINILNANAGADSGGGIDLGCGEISFDNFFQSFLGVDVGNPQDIMNGFINNGKTALQSQLVKQSLTQLYSMPTIASVLDSVNASANAQFDMMVQGCDFDEIQAEAKAAGIQLCIDDEVNSGRRSQANAVQYCDPTTQGGGYGGYIEQAKENLNKFFEETQAVHEIAGNAICGGTKTCWAHMILPPTIACGNVAGTGGCLGDGSKQTGQPPLPGMQMFNGVGAIARTFLSKVDLATTQAVNQTDKDTARSVLRRTDASRAAGNAPNSNSPLSSLLAENTTNADTQVAQLQFINFGKQNFASTDKPDVVTEFKQFMHCTEDDPLADVKSYAAQLAKDTGIDLQNAIEITEAEKTQYLSLFDFSNISGLEKNTINNLIGDAEQMAELVETATGCVANHQVHVGVGTMLDLRDLTADDQQAYILAASNRIAQLTTELLLRFMKQKTLATHITISSGMDPAFFPSCVEAKGVGETAYAECLEENKEKFKEFDIPEGVTNGILTMAEMFENQIQALNALSKERDAFAEMTQLIAIKRARLLNR